jgi:hypothetical protein
MRMQLAMPSALRACCLSLMAVGVLLLASPALALEELRCASGEACAIAIWPSDDPQSAVLRLHTAITKKPGMGVGPLLPTGFHATYRNLFFDYIDALDVQVSPEAGTITVRTQAVKGNSDVFQRQQALRQFRWLSQP